MKPLSELVRPNIWQLHPYSSARNEYSGHQARGCQVRTNIFLDANENPYNHPYNRYPDPLQTSLKQKIAQLKGVDPEQLFLGNGSDEAIDLVYRCFTEPRIDNVVAIEPTYGMYRVCADINDVEYRPVLLDEHYQMQPDRLLAACDEHTKVIWLCSPNNPTGNDMAVADIERVLRSFSGIVVIDEAYIDFSERRSFCGRLAEFPNAIVLQTFSKAWASAGVRLGMAFADKEVINIYNKVKYPYNVNRLTQEYALGLLDDMQSITQSVEVILSERSRVMQQAAELPCCVEVYPSDANFFLMKVKDAQAIYDYLVGQGIIVRNRTRVQLCGQCLRITIGTPEENAELLRAVHSL